MAGLSIENSLYFEKEMDEAINLSMLDIIEKQNINFQYEEEIL